MLCPEGRSDRTGHICGLKGHEIVAIFQAQLRHCLIIDQKGESGSPSSNPILKFM